jgi:signal peptidase I
VDRANLNAHDDASQRADRRTLLLATSFGFLLFLIVVACLPGLGPLFRIYTHPSASMLPNLTVGSYSLVSRATYGFSRYSFDAFELPIDGRWPALMPSRGDVVVFRLPRDHATQFIKRVVGLPGDRVQMIKGRLSLNGEPVTMEPVAGAVAATEKPPLRTYTERLPGGASYRIMKADGGDGPSDNTPEFAVPAENLFVLGDNRDNSSDSRHQSPKYGVGFVPVELVVGRVIATLGGGGE